MCTSYAYLVLIKTTLINNVTIKLIKHKVGKLVCSNEKKYFHMWECERLYVIFYVLLFYFLSNKPYMQLYNCNDNNKNNKQEQF